MKDETEFSGERAKLYEEAIAGFPLARRSDIDIMYKLLDPSKGERILGFGEGNGYFCRDIAESIGKKGYYLVSDPSREQLDNLERRVKLPQIHVEQIGAEGLNVPKDFFDKVWSFGAFHHVPNQTEAMKKIYTALKKGGKVIICDVFQGSDLAKHFDSQVARHCVTGHEVKFLSEEFARTLCYLAGFGDNKVKTIDLPQRWIFDSEKDMGAFVYKIHAMTQLSGTEEEKIARTIEGCKNILGVNIEENNYELNWPLKALIARK